MDATISRMNGILLYDPQFSGYDITFWNTLSGFPTIVSNKLRLNTCEILSFPILRNGDVEFTLTVPTAPTSGDTRTWGLKSPIFGNRGRIEFSISGATFSIVGYDELGTTAFISQTVPWDAGWTNTATRFRVRWSNSEIQFLVNDSVVARGAFQVGKLTLTSLPLSIHINNGNADNLDVSAVVVRRADSIEYIDPGLSRQLFKPQTIVDATNVAMGTTYYPTNGFYCAPYRHISVLLNTSGGVTTTFEVTFDGTNWQQIQGYYNNGSTEGMVASIVDGAGQVDFDDVHALAFRIKSVTADGTNAVRYQIMGKAL